MQEAETMRNQHAHHEPIWIKAIGFVLVAASAILFVYALLEQVPS